MRGGASGVDAAGFQPVTEGEQGRAVGCIFLGVYPADPVGRQHAGRMPRYAGRVGSPLVTRRRAPPTNAQGMDRTAVRRLPRSLQAGDVAVSRIPQILVRAPRRSGPGQRPRIHNSNGIFVPGHAQDCRQWTPPISRSGRDAVAGEPTGKREQGGAVDGVGVGLHPLDMVRDDDGEQLAGAACSDEIGEKAAVQCPSIELPSVKPRYSERGQSSKAPGFAGGYLLERWQLEGRRVTGVDLYRHMVESWLERDSGKHEFDIGRKQRIVQHVAGALWRSGGQTWTARQMEDWPAGFMEETP